MCQPICYQQRVVFGLIAFIKCQNKFAAISTEPLQGMRKAGREIPQIACFNVLHIGTACSIKHSDAATTIGHDCPFRRAMPVHLTNAPCTQAHVDAGNFRGNCKVGLCQLTRPAAILNALWRIVE